MSSDKLVTQFCRYSSVEDQGNPVWFSSKIKGSNFIDLNAYNAVNNASFGEILNL